MPYIEPNLKDFEQKIHSQFAEDGVLRSIAASLGITTGTYFEFGIGAPVPGMEREMGMEGNFVLMQKQGWTGVMLDGRAYDRSFGVRQEFVTALNINHLYQKHALPADLDFMSIDTDGQEFWIWMALQARPKVIVIEINGALTLDLSQTIQFDVGHIWDETIYHGTSLRAMDKLARCKNYTLVYSNGVNAICIRDDLVSNPGDFSLERLYTPFPPHKPDPLNRAWVMI